MKSAVNVYDFDHTIYDGDASLDFILYCLLRYPKTWRFLPAQFIAAALYVLGRRNRKQVKQAAFAFMRILPNPESVVASFWNTHVSNIKPWYLQQKHATDLIISASPGFLLKPIAEQLGILPPIATIMDMHTGKISGENCRADEKVKRLHAYDSSIKIANCYSDSMSDAPLLKLAKNAYLVRKHDVTALSHGSIGQVVDRMGKTVDAEVINIDQRKALLRELFLYGVIGGSTAALDVALFKVFRIVGIPLLVANFMSVSTAVGSSFILNAKYNFKKTDNLHKRGAKFFSIGYFGWFVQSIILWEGVSRLGLRDLYVKVFAVFVAAAIQYLLNKFLTFRK